ncbi:beta-ketoacyl-ACP synthase III [Streptomyces roseoverticillatus]|uniref:beta-ketoacyl-ACP synthase III n=1 Tax=Streptomyces roseoverticillatus TaxID=66429 RepID=UPI0004C1603A|nr:beta-ketoacyl-ACP synthase III [Streptomyces roseoverticillatus]
MTAGLLTTAHRHSRIAGLGTYRPRRTVTNKEICERIDSTEEWIESRSGIVTRRFASPDETLPAMAAAAAANALTHAGLEAGQIDCVIVAGMSDLVQTPPLAVAVAHALGARGAAAFDLSAACAGFCHALAVAGDMVSAGSAAHVLVIGAERMTDIVDPSDRTIAFLFADGAGAVVVGPSDEPGIGPAVRGADGSHAHALRMDSDWGAVRDDPALPRPYMRMDGRSVFRWAVSRIVPAGREAMRAAGISTGELGAFIPHQANLRMTEVMAERLALPAAVAVADDVKHSGNTSSASVPLAMERLLQEGAVRSGDTALLIGFGAGLNYAGQVVVLP